MLKLIFLATTVFFSISLSPAQPQKVLVIESYYSDFIWDKNVTRGLERGFQNKYSLTYFSLDSKRLNESEREIRMNKAWDKYLELKPNLVVLYDDAALKFIGPRLAETKTPFVFLGINGNPRDYFKKMPDTMTGILERPLFKRSVITLRKIYPQAKKILVLFDTEMTSDAILSDVFNGKLNMSISGMDFDVKLVEKYDHWKKLIHSAKGKYDFIMVGTYFALVNSQGKNVDADEVLKWTDENSSLPCFGFWDVAIGVNKNIGGFVINEENMGEMAAHMATKILEGTPPATIRFENEEKGQLVFSHRQIKKWKVLLPKEIKANTKFIE